MTSNEDERLQFLKNLEPDWFWYRQTHLGRKVPRKLTYEALEYNEDLILLDNKDILTLIDNNTFKKVANPIQKSLKHEDLSNFTEFVFDTNFEGPCTFVIVKETNPVSKKTTYSYAVSHVIDPLEPGSKHDYLMTSIHKDLKPKNIMVANYTMIAGELQIQYNQLKINFISTATSSQLFDIGIDSDKKSNWLKPNINIDDIDGEDTEEWDYYWGIFNLFLQYLKGLHMDTTNVWLPTELRGKDFSMIQNKVTKETLSKWQRNNVKLYKRIVYPTRGLPLTSFDYKYMRDKEAVDTMVYYINLCEFQNQDLNVRKRCEDKNLNLQDLIDKNLIEPYDINKRKYEIPNERPTKRPRRWSPRLLMILGDVPSNEVLSFNLKF